MFSVIVPIYNADKYLCRCIDSILAQTYTHFELLLINDGSFDKSRSICEDYSQKDARVRVFHKENGGVSSARNLGLKEAKEKFVIFCDADDFVERNWLDSFRNTQFYGNDFLVVSYANQIKNGVIEKVIHYGKSGCITKDEYFNLREYGYLWNKCFRLEIIRANNIYFDTNMDCFEDEIFVLKYAKSVKGIYFCTNITYNYICPLDFQKKYSKDISFEKQLYRYRKTKLLSDVAARGLVDWMVMKMLEECANDKSLIKSYAISLRTFVGSQIRYTYGMKKIFLRKLQNIDVDIIWILTIYLYVLMYKNGFIK